MQYSLYSTKVHKFTLGISTIRLINLVPNLILSVFKKNEANSVYVLSTSNFIPQKVKKE